MMSDEEMSSLKKKRLMSEVREVMRRRHYLIHTERSYCDWIRRFVRFHQMNSRDQLTSDYRKCTIASLMA